jgi:hypothetical protein
MLKGKVNKDLRDLRGPLDPKEILVIHDLKVLKENKDNQGRIRNWR